ncbi:hypothetical protein AXF42_Ash008805 [Apostasia shenzhenica]|uniref:Uncharacterized protein n=1 Tax=Apostasia shenzhenica TaxID=1088818 RepID=A0A2I0ASI7_9ASPA|nr:hypothetical protein AXF42_Ash008805 [Apostasia shenzhenica]
MLLPLLQIRRCLWIAGGRKSSPPHLSVLLHYSSSRTLERSSSSSSDLTVSYLVDTFGLTPAAATATTKKIKLTSVENSESLLALLESYGFTRTQISKIVTNMPRLLLSNAEKTVKPKLEFFLGLGFSKAKMCQLVSADVHILKSSLEKTISPNFDILRDAFGGEDEAAALFSRSFGLLRGNPSEVLQRNLKTMQHHGIPKSNIAKLLVWYPRTFVRCSSQFSETINLLMKFGFDPSKMAVVYGILAVTSLSTSSWKRRLFLYHSLGWSEEEFMAAFKKFPFCMLHADEMIKQKMAFFVEKLKWSPSYVAEQPVTLSYSFERTIWPRYTVFSLLSSKGMLERKFSASILFIAEKIFVKDYVDYYKDRVPEVLEVYRKSKGVTVDGLERWKSASTCREIAKKSTGT